MRFVEAVARLDPLPAALPGSPAALIPVAARGGTVEARLRAERELRRDDGSPLREAAVLVLVHPDERGEARVVLTERRAYDGHHSGEVSFPGGKVDGDDDGPVATALREAHEEVGLDPAACGLRVVGRLEQVVVAVSGFAITPVVALAERAPALVRDPDEVAGILSAPLAAFLPDAPMPVVEREVRGLALRYGIYPVDGLEIWGATARILGQLGAVIAGADER